MDSGDLCLQMVVTNRSPARKGFRSGSSPMSHEKAIFDGVRTRLGVRKSSDLTVDIDFVDFQLPYPFFARLLLVDRLEDRPNRTY